MQFPTMDKLKEILAPLKEKFEVVLFGSLVEGGVRPKSDIDVAILSRKTEKKENIEIQKDILGEYPLQFDLRVFELFPIYIQISIIEHYKVIFGNPLEISEYFYYFRKKWDDCKLRILSNQFASYHDRLSLIK